MKWPYLQRVFVDVINLSWGHWDRPGLPRWCSGKESACQCRRCKRRRVRSLRQEDPLEKEMATCSNILAWRIPWTEEPGGLQSMGLQRVGHDWEHRHTQANITGVLLRQYKENDTYTENTTWRRGRFSCKPRSITITRGTKLPGRILPSVEENGPTDTLILDSSLQNCERINL